MLKFIARIENAIFIAAIWMITAGIMGFYVKLFNGKPPLPIEVIHLPILLGMIAVVILRIRESVFGLVSVMPYFMLMMLALASFRWSLNPAFTIREALTGIIYVVYLGTMAWRYSWKELIEGMWTAMLGMAVLSILLFVVLPSVGKSGAPHPGALAGIWMEKNATGQAATFGACLALARFAISPKTFLTSGISFLIFTGMLLLSTSKTSLVAYIVACLCFGWVFMMRRNMLTFIATTWATIFAGGFLIYFIKNNTETMLGLLGRSSTFTGRSEIWKSVEISLADRPLLGHGFSGYWDLEVYGKTLAYVYEDLDYLPRHSHNSLIEMQLNLGLVGAGILVSAVLIYLIISLCRVRNTHGSYFVLPFTLAAIIIGCFESVLAYPSNFAGGIIILAAGKMVRPALKSESRSAFWGLVKAFSSNTSNRAPNPVRRPAPIHRPAPAIGFQTPAPAQRRERRTAPKPASLRPLPPMQISAAAYAPAYTPRKVFGQKPKSISGPVFQTLMPGLPPMPVKP